MVRDYICDALCRSINQNYPSADVIAGVATGAIAMGLMGPAIGVAVAWGLKAPPLVLFSSVVTGSMGAALGGPAGAFLAAAIGAEFGKAVSKETKVDILVTPATTLIAGMISAKVFGPAIGALMTGLGKVIMAAGIPAFPGDSG